MKNLVKKFVAAIFVVLGFGICTQSRAAVFVDETTEKQNLTSVNSILHDILDNNDPMSQYRTVGAVSQHHIQCGISVPIFCEDGSMISVEVYHDDCDTALEIGIEIADKTSC